MGNSIDNVLGKWAITGDYVKAVSRQDNEIFMENILLFNDI